MSYRYYQTLAKPYNRLTVVLVGAADGKPR
jgi:hypothetical protein